MEETASKILEVTEEIFKELDGTMPDEKLSEELLKRVAEKISPEDVLNASKEVMIRMQQEIKDMQRYIVDTIEAHKALVASLVKRMGGRLEISKKDMEGIDPMTLKHEIKEDTIIFTLK